MPWSRVLTFTDPFQCQSAIQSVTQAEILPTARGSFHVEMTQIGMNKVRMQRFKIDQPLISTVVIESDRRAVGFLLEQSSSRVQHCGLPITANDIFVYDNDVLHQRSASGYRFGTMSVPTNDFTVLCETIAGRSLPEKRGHHFVRTNPALMSRLRKLHTAIGQLAHDTPDLLEQPEVSRALEQQLIHAMVRCLAEGTNIETTTGYHRHDAVVARFEDFLEANPDRPLYLTEICAAIGVAERTLRASCQEHLGMGPIRFLTLRRMHLVRQALLRADPSRETVTGIVTDHGFWELGRFSVAYRGLFRESPSETLRRPAQQPPIRLDRPSSLPMIGSDEDRITLAPN
jgi:AraC-like DNA-binding protein